METRDVFIQELEAFISRWSSSKPFSGKTHALRALKRVLSLSALRR